MKCPGCGKQIDIKDVRQNPGKYYLNSNMGTVWCDNCVRKVLKAWVEGRGESEVTSNNSVRLQNSPD